MPFRLSRQLKLALGLYDYVMQYCRSVTWLIHIHKYKLTKKKSIRAKAANMVLAVVSPIVLSSVKAEGQQHQHKLPFSNPNPHSPSHSSLHPLSINAYMSHVCTPCPPALEMRGYRVGVVMCLPDLCVLSQKKKIKGGRWTEGEQPSEAGRINGCRETK